MLVKLVRDDILVEFLPDGGGGFVIDFDDAVNRAKNIFAKNVFNMHTNYK